MRFLVKATIPVEAGNAIMKDGSLGQKIESILADIKPEAAYFIEECGKRTVVLIVNISDQSQIPKIAEPLFLAFNADVKFHPAMVKEDLMKAAPDIERAVEKYG